jgi:hypothetical protein
MPVRFCWSIIWQIPPRNVLVVLAAIPTFSFFVVVVIIDITPSSFLLVISIRILSCVALFLAYIHSTDTTIHPIL